MTTLLVVDAGNTNVTVGVFRGDQLIASWRMMTIHQQTVDELSLKLSGLFQRDELDPKAVDGAVLASVVPPLTDTLARGIALTCGKDPLVIRPGVKTGMRLLVDKPDEVGADRIVNSVAAHERHHAPCIVVDFGTATTFDCVSESGDYLGGVISYSNDAKIQQLGVPARTIENHGAVSAQTAVAMAEGARRRFGADFGISVTGVAGPGGGTEAKPVGLVYLAVADAAGDEVRRHQRSGNRHDNRLESARVCLELLLERMIDFAARTGKAVDALPDTRLGRHIAGQLVRCGTSPASAEGSRA